MQLKALGLFMAAALLGGTLAPGAWAQDDEGDTRPAFDRSQGRPGFAPGSRRHAPPPQRRGAALERGIERLDSDGDAALSFDEFFSARLEAIDRRFERLDDNGDGLISGDEFERPARQPRPHRRHRPERPEIDRDAVIACVRETDADYEPPQLVSEDRLAWMDANADGAVDFSEWGEALEQRARSQFGRLDVDGDGEIDSDDLAAFGDQQLNLRRVVRACIDEVSQASGL